MNNLNHNLKHSENMKHIKSIFCISMLSILLCVTPKAKAQSFDIKSIKAKASWDFRAQYRVVFESHSLRVIARYDSFIPAVINLFNDFQQSNINLDSIPSPINIHYLIFNNGKRKLTIENPEYTTQAINIESELEKNSDSLPGNVIHIYDFKHQVNIHIYVKSPSNFKNVHMMAINYRDSILNLSKVELNALNKRLDENYISALKIPYYNYYHIFKKYLIETVEPYDRQTISTNFNFYSYEGHPKQLIERNSLGYESHFEGPLWFHGSLGMMEKNMCLTENVEIPLYTNFSNDLPRYIFYTNLGILGFSERQNTESNLNKISTLYETLLGIKFTNLNPKLKSSNDFRVAGFEFGRFFKTVNNKSTLLPTDGYVFKLYRQWGNIRINAGLYQSQIGSKENGTAGLITFQIFDFLKF